jgi:hypothetical protein
MLNVLAVCSRFALFTAFVNLFHIFLDEALWQKLVLDVLADYVKRYRDARDAVRSLLDLIIRSIDKVRFE